VKSCVADRQRARQQQESNQRGRRTPGHEKGRSEVVLALLSVNDDDEYHLGRLVYRESDCYIA